MQCITIGHITTIFTFTQTGICRYRRYDIFQILIDVIFSEACFLHHIFYTRIAHVLLLQHLKCLIDLGEVLHFARRYPDDLRLLDDRLGHCLTDPPYSIRDKFKTSRLVKFLSGTNQTEVTLVDQVVQ